MEASSESGDPPPACGGLAPPEWGSCAWCGGMRACACERLTTPCLHAPAAPLTSAGAHLWLTHAPSPCYPRDGLQLTPEDAALLVDALAGCQPPQCAAGTPAAASAAPAPQAAAAPPAETAAPGAAGWAAEPEEQEEEQEGEQVQLRAAARARRPQLPLLDMSRVKAGSSAGPAYAHNAPAGACGADAGAGAARSPGSAAAAAEAGGADEASRRAFEERLEAPVGSGAPAIDNRCFIYRAVHPQVCLLDTVFALSLHVLLWWCAACSLPAACSC